MTRTTLHPTVKHGEKKMLAGLKYVSAAYSRNVCHRHTVFLLMVPTECVTLKTFLEENYNSNPIINK